MGTRQARLPGYNDENGHTTARGEHELLKEVIGLNMFSQMKENNFLSSYP